SELPFLPVERSTVYAEDLRGLVFPARRLLQDHLDVALLELVYCCEVRDGASEECLLIFCLRRRNVAFIDQLSCAENHCPLHHVLELAHVSFPLEVHQLRNGAFSKALDLCVIGRAVFSQEMLGERWNVIFSCTKRRNRDRDH